MALPRLSVDLESLLLARSGKFAIYMETMT